MWPQGGHQSLRAVVVGAGQAGRSREHAALHKTLSRQLLSENSGHSPGFAICWSVAISRSLDLSIPQASHLKKWGDQLHLES